MSVSFAVVDLTRNSKTRIVSRNRNLVVMNVCGISSVTENSGTNSLTDISCHQGKPSYQQFHERVYNDNNFE